MMILRFTACLTLVSGLSPCLSAAIIGTNPPALPLTLERIAALPASQRPAWEKYRARSNRQLKADQDFFFGEMKKYHLTAPTIPPDGSSARSISLRQPAAWYGQAEAARIVGIVRSFQTPAGGWSKNLDMTHHARAPGERFSQGNLSSLIAPFDHDIPRDVLWNYVGTFDNDTTTTQLRFLAKVIAARGTGSDALDTAAFLRGLDYIFAAEYPNGGWPQVWPLQGGYHDGITYNDGVMVNVLELLDDVAEGRNEFSFVSQKIRALAAASRQRGIQCILNTQIVADRRRTVWGQQHDPLTLRPTSARNYEMPAQSGGESVGVMMFLMRLPNPDPGTIAAVHAAAAWLEKTRLADVAYRTNGEKGRQLVPEPGAAPLWARYYSLGADRPIFGDRDKTIHDDVSEISSERRNGYSWFTGAPMRALQAYARWKVTHPPSGAHGG
jgi:PelA/Pel-15E family pectate lyase